MRYKTISIVVPVYNEERYIKQTLQKVLKANTLKLKKEVIVVDDGSRDNTVSRIRKMKSKKILLIRKKKNEGKCAAVKTGLLKTKGDIVIIQDADYEYDPSEYPILLEPFIKYGADVVYGSRFISDRPHRVLYFWHYMGNILITLFSNMLTNLNLTDIETGFKAFKGTTIRKIAPQLKSKRFGFEPEITARISKIKNIKIYEVGVSYWGRTYAEGKKIGVRDGILAIWEVIRYNIFS